LDTWFSSWLWPVSLFDGINNPGNEEMKYYYPTTDLVTGPAIIFFWVARMIMAGYEYEGDMPYRNVYFTGIVRDKIGRKMSKQLGNSPDPIELMEQYGADGVRMGMMLTAPAGNDIPFDEALCEQGRNFCNKIWNAFRLIKGWQVSDDVKRPEVASENTEWMDQRMGHVKNEVEDLFSKYRISEALMTIYNFFWNDFSSEYLEAIKPQHDCSIDRVTYEKTINYMNELLHLLHPFTPFITEELWQNLKERKDGESLMTDILQQSALTQSDNLLKPMEIIHTTITEIRHIRQKNNIPAKEAKKVYFKKNNKIEFGENTLKKRANLSDIIYVEEFPPFSVSGMTGTYQYAMESAATISRIEADISDMEAERERKKRLLQGVINNLNNEKFVANVKAEKLESERKKKADTEMIINQYEERITSLKKEIAALRQQQ
jgi:valyl-tRNA synthetase